jgi:hypothetical protein
VLLPLLSSGCGDSNLATADSGIAPVSDASGPAAGSGGLVLPRPNTPPVVCGGNTCAPAFFVAACCARDNLCGLGPATECLEANQEGELDDRCADQALIAFGTIAKGCCKPNGMCGLMLKQPSLGCVERTALPSWASSGGKVTAAMCSAASSGN